ncbi:hypothetical protein quinque_008013 [Culex quinquefasciatus]
MGLPTVRRLVWTVLAILNLHQAVGLNYTLYPREYADISCSLSANEEGVCVYAYLCHEGVLNTDGNGLVDLRFGDVCEDYFLRCCSKATPCADNQGKCVPNDKCGVNKNLPKYKIFKESQDCAWSGYTCCPTTIEPAKPVKPTKPGKVVTTKKPTQAGVEEPEKCDGGKGICVREGQCQNIHGVGMIQERSSECSSMDHMCCPLEAAKPAEPGTCDSGKGVCLTRDKCGVDPDGVGLIEERSSFQCDSEEQVCCPLEHASGSDCAKVGGRCVSAEQCSSKLEFDVRTAETSCPKKDQVCCIGPVVTPTTESVVPSAEGKPCFNGGTCTTQLKCGGTRIYDRRDDCKGLVCCTQPMVTTTTRKPTTTRKSVRVTTPSPVGQSCSNGQGECSDICNGVPLNDVSNTCGNLDCCGPSDAEETCENSQGTCMHASSCARVQEGNFGECESEQLVCCAQERQQEPTEYNSRGCGYRNDQGVVFKITNNADGESQYGEFPWVVAIFSELHETESKFICGGSLIDPEVILTTADCVKSFRSRPEKLTIRAGEWDMRSTYEPIAHQERGVRLVKTHPTFKQSSLVNNVALLFLDDKFDLTHTIDTVCLPPQDFVVYNGDVTATGWGSTPTNLTKSQQILKSLELPFNQRSDCERILRRVMRKPLFKLDESFLCAGGYPDEDTCRGDAGSPVVFPVPDDFQNRMYAVGMVSWGVGCGKPGVPAAYTAVGKFRDWIDGEMRKEGLAMYNYDYMKNDD